MKIENIFANNQRWVTEKLQLDSDYFEKLSQGQNPDLLYIGCSDSRVTAEELMGASPGEVFVHRNIANLVPNNDLSALSVIQYAVDVLQVKHIVVCGHYGCGGVQAAMQHADLGLLNPWLRNIRDVYRKHHDELDAISDENQRYNSLVERNVREQCIHVLKTATVQKAFSAYGLAVHGWVFDLHTGRLIDLEIPYKTILDEIRTIYRIG
ncbi:MAG: carbonic anhydrase [Lentisphaeria bacterium]|nr:carbonic anhydrase [Candidatus Neomarinimicrobiota bacterium]MCF7841476.1 carbonic anhydrase [Lentisphaeria bacterium]